MSQPPDPVADVCMAVGEDTIRAVVSAFYEAVPTDPILGPLYPEDDLAGAEARLADFLIQRFGGSDRYSETRGAPRLRRRHAPFHIGTAERNRWVTIMDSALEARLSDEAIRARVREFLHTVATFLINSRP